MNYLHAAVERCATFFQKVKTYQTTIIETSCYSNFLKCCNSHNYIYWPGTHEWFIFTWKKALSKQYVPYDPILKYFYFFSLYLFTTESIQKSGKICTKLNLKYFFFLSSGIRVIFIFISFFLVIYIFWWRTLLCSTCGFFKVIFKRQE